MAWFFTHPADLSHALPRPTLGNHAVHGPCCGNRSGGLGRADRGIGTERLERRAALHGARGCPGAQRRGGGRHPASVRRPAAARQAGAGRSRPWRRQLRRPEHGCAELLPLRRSGGRNRRPRDTAVASVDPGTLPDAPWSRARANDRVVMGVHSRRYVLAAWFPLPYSGGVSNPLKYSPPGAFSLATFALDDSVWLWPNAGRDRNRFWSLPNNSRHRPAIRSTRSSNQPLD